MKATGIVRKVDDLGRLVLPMELRKTLGINAYDPVEIFVDDDTVMIKKYIPINAKSYGELEKEIEEHKDMSRWIKVRCNDLGVNLNKEIETHLKPRGVIMGWLFLSAWVFNIYNFWVQESELLIISIILGVANFWTFGILHNYKHESYSPPNSTMVNFITSLMAIVLLVFVFIMYY